ncbi:hypothetical protein ON010_g11829 [Phytophthora cinnamomi]|nr:hypothetical protein ON010_g11829 [Phytophthora cinnamomi]
MQATYARPYNTSELQLELNQSAIRHAARNWKCFTMKAGGECIHLNLCCFELLPNYVCIIAATVDTKCIMPSTHEMIKIPSRSEEDFASTKSPRRVPAELASSNLSKPLTAAEAPPSSSGGKIPANGKRAGAAGTQCRHEGLSREATRATIRLEASKQRVTGSCDVLPFEDTKTRQIGSWNSHQEQRVLLVPWSAS